MVNTLDFTNSATFDIEALLSIKAFVRRQNKELLTKYC